MLSNNAAEDIKVAFLVDRARLSAKAEGRVLWGWELEFLLGKLARVGIREHEVTALIRPTPEKLREFPNLRVLVPLDEGVLTDTTGLKSISKWHLSPLDTLPHFKVRKAIPTFHPDQVRKDFRLQLYVERALQRVRSECETESFSRKPKRFLINPKLEKVHEVLDQLERLSADDWLSVDIETGAGQINTVGFAWSPSDAIAIGCLPGRCGSEELYRLFAHIDAVLRGPSRKVFQNGIYEVLYFARYGIRVTNFAHDTMLAQKLLWAEFEKGLANVGRFYTNEPYWKDSGRVESEEGKVKDWANVRDWPRHYNYNCLDTSGTLEAAINQRADLKARGLLEFYDNTVIPTARLTHEMCLAGLPVDVEVKSNLVREYETKCAELAASLSNPPTRKRGQISYVTRMQKINLLHSKGYPIPKVRDKETGQMKDSVDEKSLKKLRVKYPDDKDLSILLSLAEYEKALSSYFRADVDPADNHIRFMLDPLSTETMRMSCSLDPWGRGFNAQTMNKSAKKMIVHKSCIFMQIDLKQAESRFVAYDSCDTDLIACLEDPARDIHSEVAAEIFGCSVEQVRAEHKAGNSEKRQLGKKSGHGANYGMAANTFVDSCLKELDLVITKDFATKVLEAYHTLFPGIRRWHAQLKSEVANTRRLTNPFGPVRYFYGRMDDDTFRQAFAHRPQSTVPLIINQLMLKLADQRREGAFDFTLHLQCHDSLTLSCEPSHAERIAKFCLETSRWHPELKLKAGRLVIPTSIEVGRCLGSLVDWGKHDF